MTTLEVFAPDSCALPHEVAVGEDEAACRLTVDLQWLAEHGVRVSRATLLDQPGRFVEHDAVRFLMTILGHDVLPVILVDGLIRSHGRYPDRDELAGWTGVSPDEDGVPALDEHVYVEAVDETVTADLLVDDEALTDSLPGTGATAETPASTDGLPAAGVPRRDDRARVLSTAHRSRSPHVGRGRAPGAA